MSEAKPTNDERFPFTHPTGWSLDFLHDQFAQGRRFRILNIVDDVTRECLGAIPDTSISGERVASTIGGPTTAIVPVINTASCEAGVADFAWGLTL